MFKHFLQTKVMKLQESLSSQTTLQKVKANCAVRFNIPRNSVANLVMYFPESIKSTAMKRGIKK